MDRGRELFAIVAKIADEVSRIKVVDFIGGIVSLKIDQQKELAISDVSFFTLDKDRFGFFSIGQNQVNARARRVALLVAG